MNIFYIDSNPQICAQYHHDVHVNKMIIETAQMLSAAHHVHLSKYRDVIYKPAYVNHPSTIWVRHNELTYKWAFHLFTYLSHEFKYRSGKDHATFVNYAKYLEKIPFNNTNYEFVPPPLCMPDQYKHYDHVQAYRNFYKAEKMFNKNGKPMDKWTKRSRPYWLDVV